MIVEIEQRLLGAAIADLTVTQKTSDLTEALAPGEKARAEIGVGKYEYSPAEATDGSQRLIRQFTIDLIAAASEIESMEAEIARELIGWQPSQQKLPMYAVESETRTVHNGVYSRTLTFALPSLIRITL